MEGLEAMQAQLDNAADAEVTDLSKAEGLYRAVLAAGEQPSPPQCPREARNPLTSPSPPLPSSCADDNTEEGVRLKEKALHGLCGVFVKGRCVDPLPPSSFPNPL